MRLGAPAAPAEALTGEPPTVQFGRAQARCGPEIEGDPMRKAAKAVSTARVAR